jgi:hypothetical protein
VGGTFILQNIENQWCHCDYWLCWWIGLRLFMEFAQDATWWFSPLHKMTTNKMCYIVLLASTGIHSKVIEWQLRKVFYNMRFASTGFHSKEVWGTFILQNIENQWCHCDYWLCWWIGLRLFMEFPQDATWWFSPLHRISTNNGVLQDEVCQHWISLTGGKRDLFSFKYWKSMMSLWLWIALMDSVKVIHGVCAGCHLMVFTTS